MGAKWFVSMDDGTTIGLYYRASSSILTVGGYKESLPIIGLLMQEYFKIKRYDIKNTAYNKIKLSGRCSINRYTKGILLLRTHGIILSPTNRLERIWW